MPGLRRPGAHARGRAGLHQVDSRAGAEVVALAVAREVLLVRAPAELGGLLAFADEAVHRPGVDEFVDLLRLRGQLRVALGDVDHLDAELARELPPLLARLGAAGVDAGVVGDVEQRLLDEVRHQARVGAVGEHGGGRARSLRAQRQRLFAQRVVGAPGVRNGRVGVAARPRLDAGVEIHRALRPAELDQCDRRHVDRHVEHEVTTTDVRIELTAIVVARDRQLHELDAVLLGFLLAAIVRGDDGDALFRDPDVTQDQGQRALSDAAESDEDDASRKLDVNFCRT